MSQFLLIESSFAAILSPDLPHLCCEYCVFYPSDYSLGLFFGSLTGRLALKIMLDYHRIVKVSFSEVNISFDHKPARGNVVHFSLQTLLLLQNGLLLSILLDKLLGALILLLEHVLALYLEIGFLVHSLLVHLQLLAKGLVSTVFIFYRSLL